MLSCKKCGASISQESAFCTECGEKVVADKSTASSRASNGTGQQNELEYLPRAAGVSDNFKLVASSGEVFIKNYHCTTQKQSIFSPRAEGYFTVTNKRVIFHGYGGSSKLVADVPIETTSGVSTYLGTGWKIPYIIAGIVCVLLGFSSLSLIYVSKALILLPMILFFLAAFLFYLARVQSYFLALYSTGANGTPINIGQSASSNLLSSVTGQGALFSVGAQPTDETVLLMSEIGAIIHDFKSLGDHAIAKWRPDLVNSLGDNQLQAQQNRFASSTPATGKAKSDAEFFK